MLRKKPGESIEYVILVTWGLSWFAGIDAIYFLFFLQLFNWLI